MEEIQDREPSPVLHSHRCARRYLRTAICESVSRPHCGAKAACQEMGGVLQPPIAGADVTCRLCATPFVPILLQFWEGDEEFAPRLVLLWDRNADQLLHYETTFYLQGDLLEGLKDHIKAL